ncbi:SCF E3 ubiquitin ligase complex F-box protein grrA [Rhodotorula toruloides]|uniref:SCF E3 ubiquitin ligase complex F-box protein grrA n=1 Tax=Rhodotorula toruloides TaxID=5286 RepID=A0A511KNQ1_RHOTO|nr:SCF E3 ubiquitin ligase complex F-box protein grrA [Rhodotorula toruloides]
MSNRVTASTASSRGAVPTYLTSDTPPTPSRSPSNASTGGDASGGEGDDSEAESDFPDGDPDDPDTSSISLAHLGPALATPKPSALTPWPFNAPGGGVTSPTQDSLGPEAIPASSLPHEILLHILRLLPSASLAPALRVCKAWCQCGVELLWHKPSFSSLAPLYKMLQVLSLPDKTFPYPDYIRRLNFQPLAGELTDQVVAKLLPCTNLDRLTLTNCKKLSSPALVALLTKSHRLVALDMTDVTEVDDHVLQALANNCPKLQGLNLSGCTKITDKGMEALALGCTSMRRIKLRKCDQITDIPIILLSRNCHLLLEVDLANCTSITGLCIMELFRTSRLLRELSLIGCAHITDDGFPDADELQVLKQSSSNSASGYPRPTLGANGDDLYPSLSSRPTSPGPDPLTTSSGALIPRPVPLNSPPAYRPFDQLRYLDLTACYGLTDAAIAGIVKYCPKLRNFILGKCHRLTDESLYAICGLGKYLHHLHLGHVSGITDRAVTAVARACMRMRYVDLAYCSNLTDLSVFELAANLSRLKRIGLVRVNNITDAAIQSLAHRNSLERIHLSYCDNLTVPAVNEMLQALPRVTHLSLTGVTAFRKRALQRFCRSPPKDYNEHQRRSFCVFSGRGVQELRRWLRSLSRHEIALLAQPDPPSDEDPLTAAARLAGAGGNGPIPPGQTAAQFAAAQANLDAARHNLAIAHHQRQLQAAQQAAVNAAIPTQQQMQQPLQPGAQVPAWNSYVAIGATGAGNMLGLNMAAQPQAGGFEAVAGAGAAGSPSQQPQQDGGDDSLGGGPVYVPGAFPNAPPQQVPIQWIDPPQRARLPALQQAAHIGGSSSRNGRGAASPSAGGLRNSAPPAFGDSSAAPSVSSSASSASNSHDRYNSRRAARAEQIEHRFDELFGREEDMDVDDSRPRRPRRDTVTRHNYRTHSAVGAVTSSNRERRDDVEMDDASDSEGEEEDISFGE